MTLSSIEREFHAKVSAKVRLMAEGVNRFRVITPFLFEDGDHLVIVLKREGNQWVLTDEAHTFMHLSYDLDVRDLQRGTRQTIISNALTVVGISEDQGELRLAVRDGRFGDALFSFVQGLLRITDVTYLTRERVRTSFGDDFRALISTVVPAARRTFDWHDPLHDPEGKYVVDCHVNGLKRPLFIYALLNDDRTRDATISLHQFEKWQLQFHSLAIFADQESINRKVLSRFSDICEKQFSSLAANTGRIERYVQEAKSNG